MTARIFVKLIVGVLCVLIVALAAIDVLVTKQAEDTYIQERRRELQEKARMLARLSDSGFSELTHEEFQQLGRRAGIRMTVVRPDGVVLADSVADPATMDNHSGRPEIAEAFRSGAEYSLRESPTVGVEMLYYAIRIPIGVLRLAVPVSDIQQQVKAIRMETLISLIYAFLPAMLVAALFARSVSSKLGAIIEFAGQLPDGGFRRRLNWDGKDELELLARKLDETAEKLENTFEELRREHAELERQERIRKDFVINVSHELRTPLASIQGYTETLLDGAIQDPVHNVHFLNIIRANAERLRNLTEDLLTLSGIEMKLRRLQPALLDINPVVEMCVESLRPLAERKNITLETERAPEGTRAFCDSEAVHQALSNLLDNAVKYTPENGHIWVSARVVQTDPKAPESVEVAVRDTGLGIPEEDLPRLFERFYRVDKARSRQLGGTGLGLAIVKHLARAMGGDVRVESELGAGAKFAITLPVQDLGLPKDANVQPQLTSS